MSKMPQIVVNEVTKEAGYWLTTGRQKFFVPLQKRVGVVNDAQIEAWAKDFEKADFTVRESAQKLRELHALKQKSSEEIKAYLLSIGEKEKTLEDLIKKEKMRNVLWNHKRGLLGRVISGYDAWGKIAPFARKFREERAAFLELGDSWIPKVPMDPRRSRHPVPGLPKTPTSGGSERGGR